LTDLPTAESLADEYGKVPQPENFGNDGNALALVGSTTIVLERNKWPRHAVRQWAQLALSGDYDNVIRSCLAVFE
jgi:hypothetical protein